MAWGSSDRSATDAREDAESAYRVCEFLGQFGAAPRVPAIARITDVHDRATRIALAAPLA